MFTGPTSATRYSIFLQQFPKPHKLKTTQCKVISRSVTQRSQGLTRVGIGSKRGIFRESSRRVVVIKAQLTARGRKIDASELLVKRTLGQGSFGEVFEGVLTNGAGEEQVVLKRVKNRVKGAQEMGQMEHLLNVYVSRAAKGSCADFLGYCEVDKGTLSKLSNGLWLLWRYEGKYTLDHYLRRRDCLSALAGDLGVEEEYVIPIVMQQIIQNLKQLHTAGLVHRDVKPANIMLNEQERRFKLIDLGACADLRTGTNFIPTESILDPNYCPPEQYVLPTDTPHLAMQVTPLAMMLSPALWMKYHPDRFDMFSVGLILLQLAVPTLRSRDKLRQFRDELQSCLFNIKRWRQTPFGRTCTSQLLEANDDMGWKLVASLLKPRKTITHHDGTIEFVNSPEEMRPSAQEALKFDFIKQASKTRVGQLAESQAEPANGFLAIMQSASSRLFSLEAEITATTSATQKQSLKVLELEDQVAKGQASSQQLVQEQSKLGVLTTQLRTLTDEFSNTASWMTKLFNKGSTSQSVDRLVSEASQPKTSEDSTAVGVANSLVQTGVAFSGIAGKVAGKFFRMLKNDTEKALQQWEVEQQLSRQRRSAEEQFLEMLAESKVFAKDGSSGVEWEWSDVEPLVCNDTRFALVQEADRREALFGVFVEAHKEKMAAQVRQAENKIKEILKLRVLSSNVQYLQVQSHLKQLESAKYVSEERRRDIFNALVEDVRAQEQLRQRQQEAEHEFRVALENLQPAITGSSSWPHIKRLLWSHPTTQTLPDSTRKALFEEYHQIIRELEQEQQRRLKMQSQEESLKPAAAFIPLLADEVTQELGGKEETLTYEEMKEEFERLQKQFKDLQTRLGEKEVQLSILETSVTNADGEDLV